VDPSGAKFRVRFLQQPRSGRQSLDLLSVLVSDLGLRVQEPRTHTLEGRWSLSLGAGKPAVHFLRYGQCRAWPATAKHDLPLGKGSALLISGSVDCELQAYGPRRSPLGMFDWSAGSSLERVVFPPDDGGVLLVSAQLDPARRPGTSHALPPVVLIRPQRLSLPGFRDPVVESLIDELSHPRQGVTAIVQRLLELFIIQGLRAELTDGFWTAPGWLGMLTDPVLRTGLGDAECISAPALSRGWRASRQGSRTSLATSATRTSPPSAVPSGERSAALPPSGGGASPVDPFRALVGPPRASNLHRASLDGAVDLL
jgi:hypothetical protein